jgi:hypothetical protein
MLNGASLYQILLKQTGGFKQVDSKEIDSIPNSPAKQLLKAIAQIDGDSSSVSIKEFELAAEVINKKYLMKQFIDLNVKVQDFDKDGKITDNDFLIFSKANSDLSLLKKDVREVGWIEKTLEGMFLTGMIVPTACMTFNISSKQVVNYFNLFSKAPNSIKVPAVILGGLALAYYTYEDTRPYSYEEASEILNRTYQEK